MSDFIYHYTSIETLSQILKNRNIRFNSLSNVDDVNESQFSDENGVNFSPHTFISCWTTNDEENLAFWNMYTPNMKGVRIKLPKDLFLKHRFLTSGIEGIQGNTLIENSLVGKTRCFHNDYWVFTMKEHFFDVVYTNDNLLLNPKIRTQDNESFTINFGEVGKYKSKIWEFQQEVRFRIIILPTSDLLGNRINPIQDFRKVMDEQIPPPIKDFYIEIRDESFGKMELTLGPKCGEAERIIVEALLTKFNPKASLFDNNLKGLIR